MGRIWRVIAFSLSLSIFIFAAMKLYGIYREYSVGAELYGEAVKQYVRVADSQSNMDEHSRDRSAEECEEVALNSHTNIKSSMAPDKIPISIDFASLKARCSDIVGWLYCDDTPMNYPVVQSDDNDYYLYRLIDGTENKNGTIFMDFRNNPEFGDWNHLIYGHNMKNGAMFGSLTDYMEQDFYEAHPFWFLLTEEKNYRIDLVGGYVTPATSDVYTLPVDTAGRDALFQMASRSSVFDADVELMSDDRLITMSTCVYDYEDARFVLVGVLREVVDGEPGSLADE